MSKIDDYLDYEEEFHPKGKGKAENSVVKREQKTARNIRKVIEIKKKNNSNTKNLLLEPITSAGAFFRFLQNLSWLQVALKPSNAFSKDP